MNIITCTDLNRPFIYGTFLEVLYRKELDEPGNNIACLIIGELHVKNIPKLVKLITKELGIERRRIVIFCGLEDLPAEDISEVNQFTDKLSESVLSIDRIRDLRYQGIPIGIGVASSIISKTRCVYPDVSELRSAVHAYIRGALFTYVAFRWLLHQYRNGEYEFVYVYNGRTYNTYPIAEQVNEDRLRYYERFDNRKRLQVKPFAIHDFRKTSCFIKKHWEESSLPLTEKRKIAREFFYNNRSNRFTDSFLNKDVNLPPKSIVVFISSDDEFASLDPGIVISSLFPDQREYVAFMTDWVQAQSQYRLFIRVHPHYEEKSKADREFWNNISAENVEVIRSDSMIDSYSLMAQAEKVTCLLSTAGIEAAYLGRPTIVTGNAAYCGQGAVYEPSSRDELVNLLNSELPPLPTENCLQYGFYQQTFGLEFEFLSRLGISSFDELLDFDAEAQ